MDDLATRKAAAQRVMEAQRELYRVLWRDHQGDWMHLDLSMGQLKALMVLAAQDGMSVGGVADCLGIGKPAASLLVDRLVQLGYVRRAEDAEDRRRTVVTPTEAGAALVQRLRQGSTDLFAGLLTQMAPDDLAALERGLRALAAVAERSAVPSPAGSAVR